MNSLASNVRIQFDEKMNPQVILTLIGHTADTLDISSLKSATAAGKLLSVDVKVYRERRSIDSNAYLWVLLQKLAEALHTTKDELYLIMLDRYGVFTHVIVKPDAVDRVMSLWRTVRNLGKVKIGKTTGYQLQCFFGSSSYDTKEMSVLIDGVVSECRELGIETLPDDELESMKKQWGV